MDRYSDNELRSLLVAVLAMVHPDDDSLSPELRARIEEVLERRPG